MSNATLVDGSVAVEPRASWYKNPKLDQWICFWSIPVFYNIFGIVFLVLGRIMPPKSPTSSLQDIVGFMQSPYLLVAASLLALSLGMFFMSGGLVIAQMKRMQGVGPALRYSCLAGMMVGSIPGCIFPMLCFALGAFRPSYDPQILALLYDIGFLAFVGSLGCFCLQYMVFAIAIFLDRREIFPKWLGYVTIWCYVTELVAAPVWITRSGPFAWDGLLAFWLGTLIFVVWEMCLCVCLYKAIKAQPVSEITISTINPATSAA